MRTLTYLVATSLDGFIAAPDGSFDAFRAEPSYLAELFALYPETAPAPARAPFGVDQRENRSFDTVLMGRATYDVGASVGLTSPYPHLTQVVISRTLGTSPDPAVRVIDHDVREHVRALKAESGLGIWLCGGGQLASTLVDEIDVLALKINPVVLGSGIPLFAAGTPRIDFTLMYSRRFDNGVLLARYARTGRTDRP
ncbi:MAG: dihydrofolate reductase family protein [Gemmatimonadaceae bacterium]|jgi:dihydrofolate reductase|nr:dihydrofolate reductase family protein [Gemmatimonadaceae bacterium]